MEWYKKRFKLNFYAKYLKWATGFHFNMPGYSIENIKVSIIEQVKNEINTTGKKEKNSI